MYDIAGDGRTALKFAANRYIIPVGSSVLDRVNPIFLASDTRPVDAQSLRVGADDVGCDLNGDLLPQINELGPSNGFNFGNFNRYEPGYKWPWAREYSAEIQRQLPCNMVVSAGYTRREKLGNFGSRNVAVPDGDLYPADRDRGEQRRDGRRSTIRRRRCAGARISSGPTMPELDSTYNGTDITLDKRMSNGWMMTGGISIGKNIGWVGSTDLNNPNSQEFNRGIIGNDTPFSFRLSGIYELPFGDSDERDVPASERDSRS